jgi:phage tail sheath protein FI
MFAVLALPDHYRDREAVAHVRVLQAAGGYSDGGLDPLLSYGALYHPWVWATNPATPGIVRAVPPDGAAAGAIAGRAYARGPWIAPANEPLHDVVALDPPLAGATAEALRVAQINVVREGADGYRWLAADTLAPTSELRSIGVRRLLQAISRYAVLRGYSYVFEPNDDAFRRAVERDLEEMLAGIWTLGAFAGATTAESFRVNAGLPPNTPASIDTGHLIAEIAVAPSHPLTFITVRLLRTGEGRLTTSAA